MFDTHSKTDHRKRKFKYVLTHILGMNSLDDQRTLHEDYPTGLFSLLEQEYSEYVLSSIVESPPEHSGSVENLQRRSGVPSPQLENCLERFEKFGILERDRKGEDDTYELNPESSVLNCLVELNGAVNASITSEE